MTDLEKITLLLEDINDLSVAKNEVGIRQLSHHALMILEQMEEKAKQEENQN